MTMSRKKIGSSLLVLLVLGMALSTADATGARLDLGSRRRQLQRTVYYGLKDQLRDVDKKIADTQKLMGKVEDGHLLVDPSTKEGAKEHQHVYRQLQYLQKARREIQRRIQYEENLKRKCAEQQRKIQQHQFHQQGSSASAVHSAMQLSPECSKVGYTSG
ncbi:hypothetical protein HOP50_01g01330 [Chloropicon primus]|uniref:Uncharacterized protein n=1 Tax=Chloropicon primus TaxID=1764295 RepID=A0A5B8MB65_9CHLO|nr:hypothetical protein A3770_01p01440 [Chloropicon primus]UPQ96842.1 hypothetical protein HOP50_01g01330 [Chloropicon primus]|mmetsp:Transcript_12645/g.35279  ORF Transcript_12645/g.35279 Transcript_12645/m.35279 type:complete len:160 (+) Transcript_12645:1075-1554(+)|eukprot:QDZ17626.1 hypothetical protein A3770_01p01440 [Chloropicon primus]